MLFEKLPKLEELHVVQVGFLGVFGPCKTIVPDPQAPPQGQLVSQSTCLGNGRRMVVRKVYHVVCAGACMADRGNMLPRRVCRLFVVE